MTTATNLAGSSYVDLTLSRPVGGPTSASWREGTLTRARELDMLCAWARSQRGDTGDVREVAAAAAQHLAAAREAAESRRRLLRRPKESLMGRAFGNLNAAEADVLRLAPAGHLLGEFPSLLNHVQRHLVPTDPRRRAMTRIAHELGLPDGDQPMPTSQTTKFDDQVRLIEEQRDRIISVVHGASSAALREQLRLRSFRNVLLLTAVAMAVLAAGAALLGALFPNHVPLCFQPSRGNQTVIVCPNGESVAPAGQSGALPDIDKVIKATVDRWDILTVEAIGLIGAAVAAAAALRGIRGSSEPHDLPFALAALKLPTGALTAFLGLLLLRGQFIPGLSALDNSGQILAWALVLGYAQQLFTRLVDVQAQSVLNRVRGASRPTATATE